MDKKLILLFVILTLPLEVLGKEEKFEYRTIKIENDSLIFNFEVNNLFNENIVEGLQKGMTTVLEYKIQLWKKRSLWIDKLIKEDIIRFKTNFDIWGKRYIVYKNDQKPMVLNIDGVRGVCQQLKNYSLYSSQELENRKEYIIAIQVTLRPISVDNYKEIQRWVIGEAKDLDTEVIKEPRKASKKAGNWLLRIVLNLSGFGDKVIHARSQSFFIDDYQIIMQGDSKD